MRLPASEKYVYPDVIYTCEPDDLKDDQGIYVTSPCLLIDVLSDSTGADNDHKKRRHYVKIPSLQYYLLVHQDAYKVEVYERSADFWACRLYEGIESQIPLNNIGVTLSLTAIYEGIEVEEDEY
jgi:Uma2 family endonuclease